MTSDHTQYQSDEEQRRARETSLKRTRPPTNVPGYEAQQFLGAGAYGEVWVALDQNTGRRVAIKFYAHRGGLDWSLLSREVEKLVFLSADRYVVQLLDVGWDAEPPYYVMEYIENGALDDRLRKKGPMSVPEAVDIFREVAIGLSHAHGKGVLHCDLKPANVLLDQDQKPRLADFGQSRLSYEQTPALGTLFYMAPEQADLEAVPDVRWDVYALGALFYCMVTGEPPYYSTEAVRHIEEATDLADRLARYREAIRSSPAPTGHRAVPGMDGALADIVDRCLTVDPEERFSSVHSALEGLNSRDQARSRRPLVMFGFVAPALLLLIMSLFGWRAYNDAVEDSDREVTRRAMESNEFAARWVAEVVAGTLKQYYRAVDEVATDDQFKQLMLQALDNPDLASILSEMSEVAYNEQTPDELRTRFIDYALRRELDVYLQHVLSNPEKPRAASWFVTDASGRFLAAAFDAPAKQSPVGESYAYRTYFHGGDEDLNREDETFRANPPPPIKRTHLSAVFQSTATNTWKLAVSTPVVDAGRTLGVLALTIELGQYLPFSGRDGHARVAVLVDGREGQNKGVIIEHPLFDELLAKMDKLPPRLSEYRVDFSKWSPNESRLYEDPLGKDAEGAHYDRQWIAARADVKYSERDTEDGRLRKRDTGLIVLVQEDYRVASEPIHLLGQKLVREGLTALGVILAVLVLLWYFVVRMLGEPGRASTRRGIAPSEPTPLHSRDTVELPSRAQR